MNNIFGDAKWIWHNQYECPNIYINFYEKVFAINFDKLYKLYISADSQYAIYINGKFVQCGQYADYPDFKVYDEVDITKDLLIGENEILIIGYCQNEDSSTYRKEKAGIIYSLKCGDNTIFSSSEKTFVSLNKAYSNVGVDLICGQLSYSFMYNSLYENEKFNLKTADVQDITMNLYERPIKKLDIYEPQIGNIIAQGKFVENKPNHTIGMRMQYSSLTFCDLPFKVSLPNYNGYEFAIDDDNNDGIYLVIDLNKENTGLLTLDIDMPNDGEILIGYGEHLDDLKVRSYVGTRNFCASYYAKKGNNKFIHPFKRAGLRYLQIHIYAKSFKLYYAGIRPTLYPVSSQSFFKCSDHLHNKIYEVCVRTLLLCMHEHYEDCPWREQALYSMDSRNQMLCGYYTFGEYEFAKASLKLMALSIREDNMLELCSPARVSITIPSFTAIYITQLYEYLIHSGDIDFIKEVLPVAKRIVDEFVCRIDSTTGLIACFKEAKYWNFYEWQSGLEGSISGEVKDEDVTFDAPLNAFVTMALRSISEIYKILSFTAESEYYAKLHQRLNTVIDSSFWNKDKNAYASYLINGELSHYCELTQSFIIYGDACPANKLDNVLEVLAEKSLLSITISHSIFKYEALLRNPEKYGKFVFNEVADIWGYMLYNNATTFWETIDGADAFGNAGSLCHGWSAIPIYLYYKYALGLNVDKNGTVEYKINPINSGLYECNGVIKTPTKSIEIC